MKGKSSRVAQGCKEPKYEEAILSFPHLQRQSQFSAIICYFQKLLDRLTPFLPQLPLMQIDAHLAVNKLSSVSDTRAVISKLNNGKVGGDDYLFPDFIKCLPPSAVQELQMLLQYSETEKIPDE
ncbi:hypothetical protein AB6A40_011008 [Gnathostoma spinigerum]|uniref:Uncharacterized protein n=1 Tax=Gnathostoma spinigerum TaxID=75299 RepID=A0ABD6EWH0_9BILA